MTRREDGEGIILKVLYREWRVSDPYTRCTVNENTARQAAKAIARELQAENFLIAEFDEQDIEERIIHAIANGNFPEGTLNPSPNECKTRIYSGLENPPTYLARI